MTTFVTFGGYHQHTINNVVFDKDCIAMLYSNNAEEGRKKAFEHFGRQFCLEYYNECPDLKYFPRGCIWVDDEAIINLL